jgi:hypothetical protein
MVSGGDQIDMAPPRTLPKETTMSQAIPVTTAGTAFAARCYRLTDIGRACVDLVETEQQTLGCLSRHLHDVLMMCGSGMWFEQLRQFMPPRSLEESLRSLLNLGLIEVVDARLAITRASRSFR